ncbi:MAG: FAD:protein FMN transferase, partial [Candidatus Omnitrophota bacterium]
MGRLFFAVWAGLVLSGCSGVDEDGVYSRTDMFMGTFVQVKVIAPGIGRDRVSRLVDEVFNAARRMEKKFNGFDPASEVNELNIKKKMRVSPEMFSLLTKARMAGDMTGGEFNILVAPALKAGGFYARMPREILDKIPEAAGPPDWKDIVLEEDTGNVVLRENAWIDLAGI